jgi:hypothetical protein
VSLAPSSALFASFALALALASVKHHIAEIKTKEENSGSEQSVNA